MEQKKAQVGMNLLYGVIILALVMVVGGIFLAFGADVVDDVQGDFVLHSSAFNVSSDTLVSMAEMSGRQDTIALIGVIVIIIGLLMSVVATVMVVAKR